MCNGFIPITSSSRGQYQIFDAYQSLNDETRDKVNFLTGWSDSDQENYLNTRESGDWFDHDEYNPESESWLSDNIEEVTGWFWFDGSLVEPVGDCEGCPNCAED